MHYISLEKVTFPKTHIHIHVNSIIFTLHHLVSKNMSFFKYKKTIDSLTYKPKKLTHLKATALCHCNSKSMAYIKTLRYNEVGRL